MRSSTLTIVFLLGWLPFASDAYAQRDAVALPTSLFFELRDTVVDDDGDPRRFLSRSVARSCIWNAGVLECLDLENEVFRADSAVQAQDASQFETFETVDGRFRMGRLRVASSVVEGDALEVRDRGVSIKAVDFRVDSETVLLGKGSIQANGARELAFDRATYTRQDGWDLDGVRADLVPLGSTAAGRLSSGALPPRFRTDGDNFEADWGWIFSLGSGFGLGPVGVVAPGAWYGAGVAFASHDASLAELQIRYDMTEDEVIPFMTGEVDVSDDERTRLAATIEHPSTSESFELRRLERKAWMRESRQSEFGLDLSSSAHVLALGAALDSGPLDETDVWFIAARYGSRIVDHRHLEVDLSSESVTRMVSEEARVHSSSAALDVTLPFGRRSSAYLAPRLRSLANFGVLPEDLGFEASTFMHALVGLEGQLAFAGRFGRVVHHVTPRFGLTREIGGVDQRPVRPPDAPEFLHGRREGFTLVEGWLEQSVSGAGWSIEMPVGVVGIRDDSTDGGFRGVGRLGFHASAGQLAAEIQCVERCGDRVSLHALSNLGTQWLELEAGAHRMDESALVASGGSWRTTSSLKFADISGAFAAPLDWVGRVRGSVRSGAWSLDTAGVYLADADLYGGRAGIHYQPWPFGYTITAEVAARSDETFFAFIGFRATPGG